MQQGALRKPGQSSRSSAGPSTTANQDPQRTGGFRSRARQGTGIPINSGLRPRRCTRQGAGSLHRSSMVSTWLCAACTPENAVPHGLFFLSVMVIKSDRDLWSFPAYFTHYRCDRQISRGWLVGGFWSKAVRLRTLTFGVFPTVFVEWFSS